MRAWRGHPRVANVLQDGRVYILDTGQKVHFEHLKLHQRGPTEFVTAPPYTGEMVVVFIRSPSVLLKQLRKIYLNPLIDLSNCFQKLRMCLCLRADDIEWIPESAPAVHQAAVRLLNFGHG